MKRKYVVGRDDDYSAVYGTANGTTLGEVCHPLNMDEVQSKMDMTDIEIKEMTIYRLVPVKRKVRK